MSERSQKAILECARAMQEMLRIGWSKSDLDQLEHLWWSIRDERGNLLPPQPHKDIVAEIRADERQKCCADVCACCPGGKYADRWQVAYRANSAGLWKHLLIGESKPAHFSSTDCHAFAIHERAFQQAQAGEKPVDSAR